MSSEDLDMDKEIKKLSRKTEINILKTERAFENRFEQLDKEIDETIKSKETMFDDSKGLTSEHITNDYSPLSADRYREKLKKI